MWPWLMPFLIYVGDSGRSRDKSVDHGIAEANLETSFLIQPGDAVFVPAALSIVQGKKPLEIFLVDHLARIWTVHSALVMGKGCGSGQTSKKGRLFRFYIDLISSLINLM